MGSGSLLLNAKKYAAEPDYIKYYGQELNTSTFNLARMNMFLHGIVPENQVLRNGDTLDGVVHQHHRNEFAGSFREETRKTVQTI